MKKKELLYLKKSLLIYSILISTTACSNKNNNPEIIKPEPVIEQSTIEPTSEVTTELDLVMQKEQIEQDIENDAIAELKDDVADYFTNTIDFIYYGKQINGITYDDLSEEAKKELLEDVKELDDSIKEFDPDYKENVSNKLNQYKTDAGNKFKNLIGDERYEKIGNAKDNAYDYLKNEADDAKEYVKTHSKSWYENNFKN
ncbi:MAG: hypothetical protein IJ574_05610 [Bacilli bacterium]|nr:hypothetical protein [Bacilli bacterium]